ncbi:nucleoid occlusion factor SlmA [uncultured Turicimonas sp.]|uniref:nucleoid occlusion factor SlmA n=1 Tax=uncultured Turicimonas sp. TaxID=1918607 RepID=UPI002804FBBD|nr:nucleoid occlusion factor SlmA [uncultured Turicimonas sp.]
MEEEIQKPKTRKAKPGERKLDILKALVDLLQSSKQKHITTKVLAAHLGLSEAALYRHFASKAQMYDALIAYVESAVFTAVNQIHQSNPSGMHQARLIATTLISLTRTNPGMVILMCGDFLTQEDERLQQRLNLLFSKLRTQLKQSLSLAVAQMEIFSDYDVQARSELLFSLILGQWVSFSKGIQRTNTEPDSVDKLICTALGIRS